MSRHRKSVDVRFRCLVDNQYVQRWGEWEKGGKWRRVGAEIVSIAIAVCLMMFIGLLLF